MLVPNSINKRSGYITINHFIFSNTFEHNQIVDMLTRTFGSGL